MLAAEHFFYQITIRTIIPLWLPEHARRGYRKVHMENVCFQALFFVETKESLKHCLNMGLFLVWNFALKSARIDVWPD